jgi:hypothetical protein
VPSQESDNPEFAKTMIFDDWPDELPITESELKLLEHHMLDLVTAMLIPQ